MCKFSACFIQGVVWQRQRLDTLGSDDNSVQSGIGENQLITAFARIQRRLGGILTLDLAGGVLFNGQFSIEDRDGRRLQSADYDSAPFVALTFAMNF